MRRKPLSKKLRFEVFKRDSFKCQYCGESAPDVVLHIDHIQPVVSGGDNSITNLITSCLCCNLGKGKQKLSDTTAVKKQKKQLDDLNERRQQLEMMVEWQKGLLDLDNDKLTYVLNRFSDQTSYDLTESARDSVRKLIKKYSFDLVLESLEASFNQYLKMGDDDKYTRDSVNKTYDMISRICAVKKRQQDNPELADIYYAKGILRNRFPNWRPATIADVGKDMERIVSKGGTPEIAKRMAKEAYNYNQLCEWLQDWESELDE